MEKITLHKSTSRLIAIIVAIVAIFPALPAVAEPAKGTLGAVALDVAASTIAQINLTLPHQESFVATITAYTSRPQETDGDGHISADGNYVYDGLIACSREYPFGTRVIIGGRTYRCGDRMAQKNDHATNLKLEKPHFDIWMNGLAAARQFGRRDLAVTVQYAR